MGPLKKLYNIIIYIYSSTNYIKEFKTLVERIISLNNRTKWNSWYLILIIVIKKAGAIDTYLKNNFTLLKKDYLYLSN